MGCSLRRDFLIYPRAIRPWREIATRVAQCSYIPSSPNALIKVSEAACSSPVCLRGQWDRNYFDCYKVEKYAATNLDECRTLIDLALKRFVVGRLLVFVRARGECISCPADFCASICSTAEARDCRAEVIECRDGMRAYAVQSGLDA